MSKRKTYVFVDKDGTEKTSNSIPVRRKEIRAVFWGFIPVYYSKNKRNKWADSWSTNEGDALPFMGTELPRGTIEKILGRKITWDDEPVEIT